MRIEIEMKDETYEKIKNVIDWINLDNSFRGRSDTPEAKIEDFIKGAAISKLLDVEAMSPVLNSEGLDSLEVKNRFKDIAKEKKIRQVDICKRTGLKKANLSLIFNNEKTLRADTFFAIWLALGCPPIHECLYIKKSDWDGDRTSKKTRFFYFFGIVQVILTIRLTKLNKNKAKVSND